MRIRIEDDFDGDLESEYRSIDNDTVIGNGELSKEKVTIIDVKAKDVNEKDIDKDVKNHVVKKKEVNKYSLNNGYSIEIQGATLINDDYLDTNEVSRDKKESQNKKSNEIKANIPNKKNPIRGKIIVCVKLGDIKGKSISEAKINLYELNGLSPKLVSSKLTNENGIVVFEGLSEGSYRVIEIINRKYFEKPTYIQWNEVTINKDLKEESIIIINKIKRYTK